MTITLASNIPSLHIQGNLRDSTADLSETYERLSSGLRINSAKDDPAGLAIADVLRADARIATAAIQQVNQGISLTTMADEALDSITTALERMAELAGQSANTTISQTQRSALSAEFLALGSEIERIAKNTTYNDINLLSNSSTIYVQAGLDGTSNSQIPILSVLGTLESFSLAATGQSKLAYSIIGTTTNLSVTAARNALTAVNSALTAVSARRGTVGASGGRLDFALRHLQVARENFLAADQRIREIDVAEEVAKLVSGQIRQLSGVAVLAHANLQPQSVLSLLS